jgi:hypothetical protein
VTPTGGINTAELSAALDYLCLHLSEVELNKGFKERPAVQKPTQAPISVGKINSKNIKRIPAPPPVGISLAPIPNFQREARTFGFIRLGFAADEAEKACKATKAPPTGTLPERDDDAIVSLVDSLVGNSSPSTVSTADAEFADMERDDEREALLAIFDRKMSTISQSRYIIDVELAEKLEPPANSDICKVRSRDYTRSCVTLSI